ncbi:hypothetical protein Psuf_072280 [Phytohabitans suffuscus]|uniref:Uncharacterized protein n=1 Tax=Phytohabitans suffuscus TaxID=624315 RepID=A0A6F8YUR0_9ACTN|nr:hypothetical protein [Phytohabitans suffuscus]BCB89915.1 hypothetical protein Psuf_072280 [Phytohabitans suffuscus]
MLDPIPAAVTRSGMSWQSAPKMASTVRWPVISEPPKTGAGGSGLTIVRGGAITSTARKQPAFVGIEPSSRQRTA